MLFPDEGHGLVRLENKLKFYAAVEKFLAQHLELVMKNITDIYEFANKAVIVL